MATCTLIIAAYLRKFVPLSVFQLPRKATALESFHRLRFDLKPMSFSSYRILPHLLWVHEQRALRRSQDSKHSCFSHSMPCGDPDFRPKRNLKAGRSFMKAERPEPSSRALLYVGEKSHRQRVLPTQYVLNAAIRTSTYATMRQGSGRVTLLLKCKNKRIQTVLRCGFQPIMVLSTQCAS